MVDVVDPSVVLEGKLGVLGFSREAAVGMGCSSASSKYASAATIPPIEWPTNMTCTEGSMVGDGVCRATSRSITLF